MSLYFGQNQPQGDAEGGDGFYQGGYSNDYNSGPAYDPRYDNQLGGQYSMNQAPSGSLGFEDEPPLLEELGINFQHISSKTLAVLFPFKKAQHDLHVNDDDLAGPFIFGVLLGFFLLLKGKVQFGYIYGVGVTGSIGMYALITLMSETGFNFFSTISVLGYCLLPMDILACISAFLPEFITYCVTPVIILWCCLSASMLFVVGANLTEQRLLVAYPLALFYTCFAILTIF